MERTTQELIEDIKQTLLHQFKEFVLTNNDNEDEIITIVNVPEVKEQLFRTWLNNTFNSFDINDITNQVEEDFAEENREDMLKKGIITIEMRERK